MPDIVDRIIAMERQIEDLSRRLEASLRIGRVVEIDPARGLVKVDVGSEGSPLLSPWLPWTERAGAIRTWTPPAPGEQVRLVAPGGEIALGWIDRGGFSNEAPPPHDAAGEHRRTIGGTTITETATGVRIETGRAEIVATHADLTAEAVVVTAGEARLDAERVELGGEGGRRVARIGDRVNVLYGSSKGLHPIVEGSSVVHAVD